MSNDITAIFLPEKRIAVLLSPPMGNKSKGVVWGIKKDRK
jgi:hypothetical protein